MRLFTKNLNFILALLASLTIAGVASADQLSSNSSLLSLRCTEQNSGELIEIYEDMRRELEIYTNRGKFSGVLDTAHISNGPASRYTVGTTEGGYHEYAGILNLTLQMSFPMQAFAQMRIGQDLRSYNCTDLNSSEMPYIPPVAEQPTYGKRVIYHCDGQFAFSAIYFIENQTIDRAIEGNRAKIEIASSPDKFFWASITRSPLVTNLSFDLPEQGSIKISNQTTIKYLDHGFLNREVYNECFGLEEVSGALVSN